MSGQHEIGVGSCSSPAGSCCPSLANVPVPASSVTSSSYVPAWQSQASPPAHSGHLGCGSRHNPRTMDIPVRLPHAQPQPPIPCGTTCFANAMADAAARAFPFPQLLGSQAPPTWKPGAALCSSAGQPPPMSTFAPPHAMASQSVKACAGRMCMGSNVGAAVSGKVISGSMAQHSCIHINAKASVPALNSGRRSIGGVNIGFPSPVAPPHVLQLPNAGFSSGVSNLPGPPGNVFGFSR